FGATLLGAFLGRKALSSANINKGMTAARGIGRTMKESQDINRAQENVGALQGQLETLQTQFREETAALEPQLDPSTETFETVTIKPSKTNISVRLLALVWAPYWKNNFNQISPAWQ